MQIYFGLKEQLVKPRALREASNSKLSIPSDLHTCTCSKFYTIVQELHQDAKILILLAMSCSKLGKILTLYLSFFI